MKGIYLIAVAFLASGSVCTANEHEQSIQKMEAQDDLPRKCPYPDINPKNTTTNIAHESDCTKFYKCFVGRGTEQLCPLMWPNDPKEERLQFNRALQVCDWPWEAGCNLCPDKDKNGKYPPESWIANPDSSNCRDYIICRDGNQIKGTCPANECFSRLCQGCVKNRNDGNCDDNVTATPPPPTTPPTTPLCETGNRMLHDCDCTKYYQCYDNKDWILQNCDGGLHFSPVTWECMLPDEAKCPLLPKK